LENPFLVFEKWRENQNIVVLVLGEKRFQGWNFFCVLVFRFRGLRKRIKWFWFLVWFDSWIFPLFFVFAECGSKEKDLGLYALLSLLVLVSWDSLSLGARIDRA